MKNNHNFYNNLKELSGGALSDGDIQKAASGDVSGLIDSLPAKDAEKIRSIISDPAKRKEILSSDAAVKLMKLLGGKNNG